MQGPIANPLPKQESEYSEAVMGDQMKTSYVDRADPGLTSTKMELPSSPVMEQDKADVSYDRGILCNPLAGEEPKDCLTGENSTNAIEVWHLAPISIVVQLLSLQYHSCWFLLGSTTYPLILQESNSSEAENGNQTEACDNVAGVNTDRLLLRNIDIPSSSLMMEENKIEVSCDKGPLCSLLALGESKDCLTGEGSCRDATEVRYFVPI